MLKHNSLNPEMFTILRSLNFWWFQEYSGRPHLAPQYSKDMLIVWAFYMQGYYQTIYTKDGEELIDPKVSNQYIHVSLY